MREVGSEYALVIAGVVRAVGKRSQMLEEWANLVDQEERDCALMVSLETLAAEGRATIDYIARFRQRRKDASARVLSLVAQSCPLK